MSSDLQSAESLYVVGYPMGRRLGIDKVTVPRGIFSARRQPRNNVWHVQTDAPMKPGNSGGPVGAARRLIGSERPGAPCLPLDCSNFQLGTVGIEQPEDDEVEVCGVLELVDESGAATRGSSSISATAIVTVRVRGS